MMFCNNHSLPTYNPFSYASRPNSWETKNQMTEDQAVLVMNHHNPALPVPQHITIGLTLQPETKTAT
jgi:hypothetical protein